MRTTSDRQAIDRYRYLVRTAPPDELERVHQEAFEQLTPEQRREVLADLSAAVPESERPRSDDARDLARAATRAELRQPGTLDRLFTREDGSLRIGRLLAGSIAGSLLATTLFDDLLGIGHPGILGASATPRWARRRAAGSTAGSEPVSRRRGGRGNRRWRPGTSGSG